jgi:hypothetical protein
MFELIIISLLCSILMVLILRHASSEVIESVAIVSGMILFFVFIALIMLLPNPNIIQIIEYTKSNPSMLEKYGFLDLLNAFSPMYTIAVALSIIGYAINKRSDRYKMKPPIKYCFSCRFHAIKETENPCKDCERQSNWKYIPEKKTIT